MEIVDSNSTPTLDRQSSLGFFHVLSNERILELLEWLDIVDLLKFSRLNILCYILSHQESLWKSICIRKFVQNRIGHFTFNKTWRFTTLSKMVELGKTSSLESVNHHGTLSEFPTFSLTEEFRNRMEYVMARLTPKLYKKWNRARVSMSKFSSIQSLPRCLDVNHSYRVCHSSKGDRFQIDKRSNLSKEQFILEYESKNRPVIITDATCDWPGKSAWLEETILKTYGDTLFKTNATDPHTGHCFKLALKDYFAYMNYNEDDKPIYLFDNKFFERAPSMLKDYRVPEYFSVDLFEHMKTADRPDWRWFLVGPPRSGSPFHQDPHRSSAWNALIVGRKRWALYPPHIIPPGVDEDLIDSDYYAAPNVMKWYSNVYPKIDSEEQLPIECIQEAGEIIFVPSGWWHQVLNLEKSIAITQNFCSPQNFDMVYRDMLTRKSKSLRKQFTKAVYPIYRHLFKDFEPIKDISSQDSDSTTSEDSDVS